MARNQSTVVAIRQCVQEQPARLDSDLRPDPSLRAPAANQHDWSKYSSRGRCTLSPSQLAEERDLELLYR